MSGPRKRGPTLFDPKSDKPFQLSRYRIERFMDCPRCFYMELRRGLKRPEPFPYTLNNAVDILVKKEFDVYRKRREQHPLMKLFNVDGVPYDHPKLEIWRQTTSGKGMRHLLRGTNLDIMGSPDDIWLLKDECLSVVDTKATSANETRPIEDDWWRSYKRQIDIYNWLLKRQNTWHEVGDTSYFVLLNGDFSRETFDLALHFKPLLVAYKHDDSWVEAKIREAHRCLLANKPPLSSESCEHCAYARNAKSF